MNARKTDRYILNVALALATLYMFFYYDWDFRIASLTAALIVGLGAHRILFPPQGAHPVDEAEFSEYRVSMRYQVGWFILLMIGLMFVLYQLSKQAFNPDLMLLIRLAYGFAFGSAVTAAALIGRSRDTEPEPKADSSSTI